MIPSCKDAPSAQKAQPRTGAQKEPPDPTMATSAMWPTRGPPRGGTRHVLTLPMGVVAGISALDQLATQRAAALTSREAGRDNAELGAIEGPPEVGPTECAASRRRLAWSFASSVHSVARTRLAEFLQRSAAALAMPHTLYYPWLGLGLGSG